MTYPVVKPSMIRLWECHDELPGSLVAGEDFNARFLETLRVHQCDQLE